MGGMFTVRENALFAVVGILKSIINAPKGVANIQYEMGYLSSNRDECKETQEMILHIIGDYEKVGFQEIPRFSEPVVYEDDEKNCFITHIVWTPKHIEPKTAHTNCFV